MKHTATKNNLRQRRHKRVRSLVRGTEARPRLVVFRSNRYVEAQLINDDAGKTVAAAHGREFKGSPAVQAAAIGAAIAERGKAAGVGAVVFDRGGYRYAGLIKGLADAARAGGLTF